MRFLTTAVALSAFALVACGGPPAKVISQTEVAPGLFVVAIAKSADPATFEALGSEICIGKPMCMVGFWEQGAEPSSMPFTETQIAKQLFAYTINHETGFQRSAWDCEKYTGYPREQCIPRIKAAP